MTDTRPPTPAAQRELVRRGYDAISHAYRSDHGSPAAATAEETGRYAGWLAEVTDHLPEGAVVLDLGDDPRSADRSSCSYPEDAGPAT